MYVVMGGTGHVGSGVASTLLARGEPVGIVTHHAEHAKEWKQRGAEILVADIWKPASLRAAFKQGRRAFVLNPPADTSLDTDIVERQTVANILEALEESGLEKVVAASTGGAQAGDRIGDLNVLWELEQGLGRLSTPAAVQRGAYYMSNWFAQIDAVSQTGQLHSMIPADMAIPMVAPSDLGKYAAERLLSSVSDVALRHVEGPRRYSPRDVAQSVSQVLGRPVEVVVTPRAQMEEAFRALGFSAAAAESYARMTRLSIDNGFAMPDDSVRGDTSFDEYLHSAFARA
ncbi:putative nucleoside-diphosphate sugar epimerase [Acidovorax sp. CF316]|uniref:NmrA family NAD(P)-binding protein n=1 Tax=Acidovorax sp. CF316 TaxID=1144317 RepID=UPI00026BE28C|nr:NmrA family NAD(P)-binding protein [Acidovorax sp. CF316]EJE50474.1 putative nucleoside-diphosphate sugar epimerase [Acidovorax sp. CF316]